MDIKTQAGNPVMFLVFISAILTTILLIISLFGIKDAQSGYTFTIAIILWFTVLFANFAESVAEGRGKAQAIFSEHLERIVRNLITRHLKPMITNIL